MSVGKRATSSESRLGTKGLGVWGGDCQSVTPQSRSKDFHPLLRKLHWSGTDQIKHHFWQAIKSCCKFLKICIDLLQISENVYTKNPSFYFIHTPSTTPQAFCMSMRMSNKSYKPTIDMTNGRLDTHRGAWRIAVFRMRGILHSNKHNTWSRFRCLYYLRNVPGSPDTYPYNCVAIPEWWYENEN